MDTNPTPEVAADPQARLEEIFAKQLGEDKPKAEVEAPEPEEDEPDTEPDETEEVETDQPEVAKDEEEVDVDGETFKLPKKVKEAVLRNKDYTQKTQELASLRKMVEDRQQFVEARESFVQHAFKEATQVEGIKAQLGQFESIDWTGLIQSDPQRAMQLNFAQQQLRTQLQTAEANLGKVSQRIQEAHKQHQAKQKELGSAELARRLGNISEQDRASMLSLAHELGYEERDLMSVAAVSSLAKANKLLAENAELKARLDGSKKVIEKKVAQAKPLSQPAARTSMQSAEQAKTQEIRERLRKGGRTEDAEALLARIFEAKARKR